jgi:hypothetical protein
MSHLGRDARRPSAAMCGNVPPRDARQSPFRRAMRGNLDGSRVARSVARLAREKVRRPKLAFEPTRRDNLRP